MSVLLAASLLAVSLAADVVSDGRPRSDGWIFDASAALGGGNTPQDQGSTASDLLGALNVAAGYRAAHLEGGLFLEYELSGAILGTQATIVGVAAFGGLHWSFASWAGVELRGRLGEHFCGLSRGGKRGGSTTLTFVGLEPRLYFRVGGERAALLLALIAFVEEDVGSSFLPQPLPIQGNPQTTLGGTLFGVGPSIGFSFR